jgi:hypothetical protein
MPGRFDNHGRLGEINKADKHGWSLGPWRSELELPRPVERKAMQHYRSGKARNLVLVNV